MSQIFTNHKQVPRSEIRSMIKNLIDAKGEFKSCSTGNTIIFYDPESEQFMIEIYTIVKEETLTKDEVMKELKR